MGGWILVGVIAGVIGGLVAQQSEPALAALGGAVLAVAGVVGYENIVKLTDYHFGVGSCPHQAFVTPEQRLACLSSAINRLEAAAAFGISFAVVGLATWAIADHLASG